MIGESNLSFAKLSLEVARERVDPDAFNWLGVAMQGVELAATLRIPEELPVGGLVTGSGKARLLDEGFEQDRPIGIVGLPVIGQSLGRQSQDAGSKIFAVDPRQDQEPCVVDDEMQIAFSLICGPANELVPGLYFPGARAEAEGGDDVVCGAHEVAQLRPGHELMSKIVMALDVRVPQQRVGFGMHQINAQRGEFDGRDARRLEDRLLNVRIRPVGDRLWISRRRQGEQAIGLHAQHGDATTHVFEPAIGSPPVQPLTNFAREPGAIEGRLLREQGANEFELLSSKITSAVLHRSTRINQARLSGGTQGEYRLVQTDPAAPYDRHARLAITFAPEMTAEAAEHAYRFTQARGFSWWQGVMYTNVQRFDLRLREHLRGRQVRLHAREVSDMHQAYANDAEEREVARETFGGLKQAVLDLAARLQHLVPSLYAPASRVPLNLLDCTVEIWHGQIGEQHPANRLLPLGRGALRRRNHLHTDRLRRARGLGGSAPVWRFDRDRRDAHLNLRGTGLALAVAGNLHCEAPKNLGAGVGVQNALETLALFGHEQPIGACTDEKTRAQLGRLCEKLEEIRFPI